MSDCGMSTLHLLSNKELAKFVQKIGHYQAARIIEERRVDGRKILELTERNIFKWHLTAIEEELLWKCIYQLKLNHLPKADQQKPSMDKNKSRQNVKYFKYNPKKQNDDLRNLISSMDNVSDAGSEYYPTYIPGPTKKNFGSTFHHVEAYLMPRKSEQYELLSNCSDSSYLTALDHVSEMTYETAPVLIKNKSKSGKKKRDLKLESKLKVSCFSCGIACIAKSYN